MAYPIKKKNEVSSFTRSKVTEGSQNLKSRSRDTDHAPLWVIHHPLCSTRRVLSNKEKTKCLALKSHIWNRRPDFAYSLYNFYGATMTTKGRLLLSVTTVKRFSAENFISPLFLPKFALWVA